MTGTNQIKENIDIDSLIKLAIFLDGFKQGKGNLLPLGTETLDQLWATVKYLQGDVRFQCKEFEEKRKLK